MIYNIPFIMFLFGIELNYYFKLRHALAEGVIFLRHLLRDALCCLSLHLLNGLCLAPRESFVCESLNDDA